ncbi:hypothetical protein HDU96_006161 [Phlyctochytrium bullatum]|nr:hypothetical protein HDU96_006161 [Phlyctochytrium bullatum]
MESISSLVAEYVIGFRLHLETGDDEGLEKRWLSTLRTLLRSEVVDPTASQNLLIRAAAAQGWVEAVVLLLGYRGPVKDPAEEVELMTALPKILDPSDGDNEALRSLANLQDHQKAAKIAEWLLRDPRVDPSTNYSEPFRAAASSGNVDLLKSLVDADTERPTANSWRLRRIDPNACDGEALLKAIEGNHVETVRFLLEKVPQLRPDMNDNAAIRLALRSDRHVCLQLLTDHGQRLSLPIRATQ